MRVSNLGVNKKTCDFSNSLSSTDVGIAKEIPVLMYHHLLKTDENIYKDDPYIISVENFENQMQILYENDFNTITLKMLDSFLNKKINLPEKSILITFDDGNKSYWEYAYPILKKYSFRAVLFLITSIISKKSVPFDPTDFQYLSFEELDMSKDVFEFASHTHNFHELDDNEVSYLISKPKKEIIKDLKSSIKILKTKYFAYPFGEYDKRTIKILKDLGFRMAFTTNMGTVKLNDNMLALNRIGIDRDTSIDEFRKFIGIN